MVISATITGPQKQADPRWSLGAALAGLPLALIAVGPALVAGVNGRSLPVYASQIAVAVLVVHIGFSVIAQRSYGELPVTMRWLLVATALLAIPLIWSTDPGAGVLAYFNFASGTVGGIAIALVWKSMSEGYSWIDIGYIAFLIAGTAQLLVRYSGASSVNSLHQSSPMPWGVSSVVAGGLVVAALTVIARSASLVRYRKLVVTAGLVAIAVALLTLTRGAIIAAGVGAVVFLWARSAKHRPRQLRPGKAQPRKNDTKDGVRILLRVLALCVPVAVFIGIERATALRAQLDRQVHTNIDIRFEMYRLAWEEFLRNPLTGTGWASFREVSLDATGQSETFAHNLVVSMFQIGGLLSIPYLVALSFLAYRAMRHGGPYTAAVAAAIAISMTQPFFESTVCNLIVLPIALLAGVATTTSPEIGGCRTVVPPTGSTRTRLRPTRRKRRGLTS
ncbi:O-antigen ligase family protein [Mycolicibacterium arenosum]|uniref:O-antigen ligase family protein n=1 Tax=Mycolicibacterium arenosum TaxID=2952157 RepID=A0ABT1M8Z9_9MYCO|nr:O-antigen ligase family protein [Mycolicibacterium sp. CAU 1645]MCP9275302.1 O-antigen ligase family protein [Mycolicibacterium sp. CAU 1645]